MPSKIGRFRTQSEPRNAALSSPRSFWPEEGKWRQYGCKTTIRCGSPTTNSSELSNETATEVFDDVLFSENMSERIGVSFRNPEPIRSIGWQAQGNALSEHIAGPNCEDTQSYNGNHISAAEMTTCISVQCLIEKAGHMRDWLPEWASESDGEDFERESKYFLSGLGDRIGSWEDRTCYESSIYRIGIAVLIILSMQI